MGNLVAVIPEDEPEKEKKTSTGIIIPQKVKDPSFVGTVVAIGPGLRYEDGTYKQTTEYQVGDRVVFNRYTCEELDHPTEKNKRVCLLADIDVLALVGKDTEVKSGLKYRESR
jgi:chaperonin GroES